MIKKLLIFALMVQIAGFSIAADSLTYNKSVTLKGKVEIVRSTHPNPTFRGTKQPAIRLSTPIDVIADPEDDMTETEKKVSLIQLFSGGKYKLYNQLLHANGKTVTIYCSDLFHSHTAHHTTKVLCTIDSVKFGL